MDWLTIVSLITSLFSVFLAVFSIVTTYKTEERIIKICKNMRKLIDGKDDKT